MTYYKHHVMVCLEDLLDAAHNDLSMQLGRTPTAQEVAYRHGALSILGQALRPLWDADQEAGFHALLEFAIEGRHRLVMDQIKKRIEVSREQA